MLAQDRIPIAKLKQAFGLNEQDAETIISALWPNGVFPYALWEEAYKLHWEAAVSHNRMLYKALKPFSLPEFDPLKYHAPPLHIYCDRIVKIFLDIATKIFVTALKEGFHHIIASTYEENDKYFHDDMEYLFNGLSRIESEHNSGINRPFTWEQVLTGEQFEAVFEDKALFLSSGVLSLLPKIFKDTIVLDKSAAVNHLLKYGYSLQQKVKGISQPLVDCLIKTSLASPPEKPPAPSMNAFPPEEPEPPAMPLASSEPADRPEDTPAEASATPFIVVPRYLWEGKSPQAVRNGMRERGYADPVIAYVLFNWCNQANKTRIGKWLANKPAQEDSTHRRRASNLLKKADTLNIASD